MGESTRGGDLAIVMPVDDRSYEKGNIPTLSKRSKGLFSRFKYHAFLSTMNFTSRLKHQPDAKDTKN